MRYTVRTLLLLVTTVGVASFLDVKFASLWLVAPVAGMAVAGAVVLCAFPLPMETFLQYVNPCLALFVLVVAVHAASMDGGKRIVPFSAPLASYFLAKGVFCATALFLLGKLLERSLK